MSTTIAETKEAAGPDGLHSVEGVAYLAKVAGFEGEHLPTICIFDQEMGFSETTGFIKSSNGRGYYRTTLTACTCPSFKFRGGLCKHQKRLAEALHRRGERLPAHVELSTGRPEQLPYPAKPGARWGANKMTSGELEARRRRIAERNAKRAEEKARAPKPSTAPRGFNMPEEVRA